MADDLRAKIAEIFVCRCDPVWTERKLHAPDCVEELGDDVIEVFADWLRDLAEMRNSSWLPVDPYAFEDPRDVVGRALHALADVLTQPSTEESHGA